MEIANKRLFYGILITTILLFVFLYFSRRVVTPFFIAFALAYLMDPLVDRLEKAKISRTPSVIILMVGFFLLVFLAGIILLPLLKVQVEHLAKNLPDYMGILQSWFHPIVENIAGLDQTKIKEILKMAGDKLGSLPLEVLGSASNIVWSSLASLMNLIFVLINTIIIPVAMFYLLRDFDYIVEKLKNLIPPRFQKQTIEIFKDIDQVLSRFVRGQLMVATLMGVLYSIGLFICGTPMSLFIGMMAGYANLVPYLGLVVGFVPAALLTFLQFQELMPLLGVVVVFAVVQALEGMVITPRVVGDQLGLHPVAIMLAVLIGAELFGFLGVLLAVPVAAVLNVLLRRGLLVYKKSSVFS